MPVVQVSYSLKFIKKRNGEVNCQHKYNYFSTKVSNLFKCFCVFAFKFSDDNKCFFACCSIKPYTDFKLVAL